MHATAALQGCGAGVGLWGVARCCKLPNSAVYWTAGGPLVKLEEVIREVELGNRVPEPREAVLGQLDHHGIREGLPSPDDWEVMYSMLSTPFIFE